MALHVLAGEGLGGLDRYVIPGVGDFNMPAVDDLHKGSIPTLMFSSAVVKLGKFADEAASINEDARLSMIGRAERLEPLQKDILFTIARADASIDVQERHWNQQEADLLALPQIDPTNAVAAIEARECRDWFRSQSSEEQRKVMEEMRANPADQEIMMLAFLRSPIPQLDGHAKFARSLWNEMKQKANPDAVVAIEQGRKNVEWARRGVAFVAGISKNAIGWDHERIAGLLLSSEDSSFHSTYKVFGIGKDVASRVKLILKQQALAGR